jgi:ribosome-associated protein
MPTAPDDALPITGRVRIPRSELELRATRAGGPGGQHVNTSSTRIELRWNVQGSVALTDAQRALVLQRLGPRLTSDGTLRLVSSEHRSQAQNRVAAEARLVALLRAALVPPVPRRPTRPTRGSVERRLDAKRQQGQRKRDRGWRSGED